MTVEAVLSPRNLAVDPGGTAHCEVQVTSTEDEPIEVRLRVRGEAAAWTAVFPPNLALPAGGQGVARLVLTPPRASRPLAGPVPLEVELAVSGGDEPKLLVADAALEIRPLVQASAVITPLPGPGPRSVQQHRLVVENRGNTDLHARLKEDGGGVVVDIEPSVLIVGPGHTAESTVTTRVAKTFLAGTGRNRAFRIAVQPSDQDPIAVVQGRAGVESILPAWAPKAAAGLGAMALVAGLLQATVLRDGSRPPPPPPPTTTATATATGAPSTCPASGHEDRLGSAVHTEESPERILPFDYSFMRVAGGCAPARFDPCQPVHYVVNPANAPSGALDDVREAMAQLATATGMNFVYDGTTDETVPPSGERPSFQPRRYGQRWAPVLIAWERHGGGTREQTVGRGGPTGIVNGVILTGYVGLNVDAVANVDTRAPVRSGFGTSTGSGPVGADGVTWGRVLLHELAHLVGLGHSGNRASLMYPKGEEQTTRPARFIDQDLAGLRLLGPASGCLRAPPPQPVDVVPPTTVAPATGAHGH
jgi:hypothetical protein